MSRINRIVEATEKNKNQKFKQVPTSGQWNIAYGKDHTDMGYFIDFEPIDGIAKSHCPVSFDGREDPDDVALPEEEWEYGIISLDQLFTSPRMSTEDWVDILLGFGIENLLV
ncbi:MAG: hypothetical protein WA061_02705 [Microgenomates group bacterium]